MKIAPKGIPNQPPPKPFTSPVIFTIIIKLTQNGASRKEGTALQMKKIVLLAVALVTVAVLAAGCGRAAEIVKPQPSEGAKMVQVTGECTAVLADGKLTVSGTTDLMDGTNGVISVVNSDGTTAEEVKFTKGEGPIEHTFEVKDAWQDIVYGFVMFDTKESDKQPDAVTAAYGKKFENLEGAPENVIWNANGVIAIFMSGEVKVR